MCKKNTTIYRSIERVGGDFVATFLENNTMELRILEATGDIDIELLSWMNTSHKDHLEVCLPKSRLLSGLIGMWSSMKITLH